MIFLAVLIPASSVHPVPLLAVRVQAGGKGGEGRGGDGAPTEQEEEEEEATSERTEAAVGCRRKNENNLEDLCKGDRERKKERKKKKKKTLEREKNTVWKEATQN